MFLVLAIGVILRILRLDGPVTYDEALTYVNYSSRSFGFLFSDYMYTGNHILHSAFVRISTLIFGVHLWSLRLPALIAGILVMPLFYAFVRALFNRHIAVIALCLLAVSGPLVEYSALARGYGLTWFFMVCSLLAARHFVKHENSVSVVMLGLFCALGMWAAPVMIPSRIDGIHLGILHAGDQLSEYRAAPYRQACRVVPSVHPAESPVLFPGHHQTQPGPAYPSPFARRQHLGGVCQYPAGPGFRPLGLFHRYCVHGPCFLRGGGYHLFRLRQRKIPPAVVRDDHRVGAVGHYTTHGGPAGGLVVLSVRTSSGHGHRCVLPHEARSGQVGTPIQQTATHIGGWSVHAHRVRLVRGAWTR
ncbi:MAG: glycosyltransferase family 39 protein [Flavobacteriales bacterium]|nr:glycosyltransferase family 39 protein [Flavobacteriales bacterium]